MFCLAHISATHYMNIQYIVEVMANRTSVPLAIYRSY